MKDITGEISVQEFEAPTLKTEPKKTKYKVRVNVFPVDQLNEWRKMVFVIDGDLYQAHLSTYHIGNKEYWVTDLIERDRKPKNIKVYRYG